MTRRELRHGDRVRIIGGAWQREIGELATVEHVYPPADNGERVIRIVIDGAHGTLSLAASDVEPAGPHTGCLHLNAAALAFGGGEVTWCPLCGSIRSGIDMSWHEPQCLSDLHAVRGDAKLLRRALDRLLRDRAGRKKEE
jgi:hypothetical protein